MLVLPVDPVIPTTFIPNLFLYPCAISKSAFLVSSTFIITLSLYFSKSKRTSSTIQTSAPNSKALLAYSFPLKLAPFKAKKTLPFSIFLVSVDSTFIFASVVSVRNSPLEYSFYSFTLTNIIKSSILSLIFSL